MNIEKWEPRFKACGAAAAAVSAIGLVIGGVFGLYNYRHQGLVAEDLKEREIRLMQFSLKKDVYYELVDAAAAVASSATREDAIKNAARYSTLYFGRAHILAIDDVVNHAKVQFRLQMEQALKEGVFPSQELQWAALELSRACQEVLHVQSVFTQTQEERNMPSSISQPDAT